MKDKQLRKAEEKVILAQIEETVGLNPEQLMSLPEGELCFAMVAPAGKTPQPVVLAEASNSDQLKQLIERAFLTLAGHGHPGQQEGLQHRQGANQARDHVPARFQVGDQFGSYFRLT